MNATVPVETAALADLAKREAELSKAIRRHEAMLKLLRAEYAGVVWTMGEIRKGME